MRNKITKTKNVFKIRRMDTIVMQSHQIFLLSIHCRNLLSKPLIQKGSIEPKTTNSISIETSNFSFLQNPTHAIYLFERGGGDYLSVGAFVICRRRSLRVLLKRRFCHAEVFVFCSTGFVSDGTKLASYSL